LLDQQSNTRRDRPPHQQQHTTTRPSSSYGMLTSSSAHYTGNGYKIKKDGVTDDFFFVSRAMQANLWMINHLEELSHLPS
jgi:hypothetical protein